MTQQQTTLDRRAGDGEPRGRRLRAVAAVVLVLGGVTVWALGGVPLFGRLVELLGGPRVYLELALMAVGAGIAGYGVVGIDLDGGAERKGPRR